MERAEFARYLADKKETIKRLVVLPRNMEMTLTKEFITPIIGPRRAGKSYFLYDLIKNRLKIKDSDFIFLNFEDPELSGINFKEIADCISTHEENYGKKPEFVFLDEVQSMDNWHIAVKGLYESKQYFIFLSGSSSKVLSKEIASSLRGRTLSITLLPFSFKEFLAIKQEGFEAKKFYSTSEENKIKNNLREYLNTGGFPNIVLENNVSEKFFKEYLDLVVFRDIIERHRIKNTFIIKFLIKAILASFSKEFSIHKIFSDLKSQGIKASKKTLYNYSAYLEDAFFAFFLKKFSYSIKESELSLPKIFINDTGLANSAGMRFSENIGKLIENAVFLKLKQDQNKKPNWEFYYYKLSTGREVDFVVREGMKTKELIQVTYSSSISEIDRQTIKTLLKASKELKCRNLLVITWNYENEKTLENKKIKFTPLWKWLLLENQ